MELRSRVHGCLGRPEREPPRTGVAASAMCGIRFADPNSAFGCRLLTGFVHLRRAWLPSPPIVDAGSNAPPERTIACRRPVGSTGRIAVAAKPCGAGAVSSCGGQSAAIGVGCPAVPSTGRACSFVSGMPSLGYFVESPAPTMPWSDSPPQVLGSLEAWCVSNPRKPQVEVRRQEAVRSRFCPGAPWPHPRLAARRHGSNAAAIGEPIFSGAILRATAGSDQHPSACAKPRNGRPPRILALLFAGRSEAPASTDDRCHKLRQARCRRRH